jgi:hypothetical protein
MKIFVDYFLLIVVLTFRIRKLKEKWKGVLFSSAISLRSFKFLFCASMIYESILKTKLLTMSTRLFTITARMSRLAFTIHRLFLTSSVTLFNWQSFGEMRSLAFSKYGLNLHDSHLPGQTLEQGTLLFSCLVLVIWQVWTYCKSWEWSRALLRIIDTISTTKFSSKKLLRAILWVSSTCNTSPILFELTELE